MNQVCRHAVAVIVLLLGATEARAQAPLSLSLDEALRRGVAQAPRLAEARAREAAAAATVTSRSTLGLPTLTTVGSFLRTNHVDEFGVPQANGTLRILFPDIPDNYRVREELGVPVFTGGRVGALVESARNDERAAGADRRVVEQDVRLEVVRSYWALVTSREQIAVLERGLQRTDAYVGDVRSRVETGILPPNDLLTAQAQRARQAVRVVQAKNAAASAEIDLARLIGAPVGQPIVVTTVVGQPTTGLEGVTGLSAEALVARALESRAEREGITDRQAALRASAVAALASMKPTVAALAAVEPSRPNPRFVPRTDEWKTSWDLGISVSWSLFDGGRARADAAAATAQAEAVGARLTDFDAIVGADVRQRLLDLESGRAALVASDEAVSASTEARRVVEERFRAGVATSTDVLDAQVALLEAELERTMLAAALRWSEARLLRALGAL
jgi:outer membrane protein TolC